MGEMDGSLSKLRFAAFRLVPYHACDCQSIPLTHLTNENINDFIDKTHKPGILPTDKDVSIKTTPQV